MEMMLQTQNLCKYFRKQKAVNNLKDSEDEELHLVMVDNHIPAGAKLY